ncbi:MAG: hypothetical protein ACMG6S_25090, partial [Byssovorax sp.]
AAMTKPAPPLASVLPSVPSALATVVDRALAHDIDGRWSDARTMQTMVRLAFQELGVPAGDNTGRWRSTVRMSNHGATPLPTGQASASPRGSVPSLGGMMATPLVAPPRSVIPPSPAVPFQMADPLTGLVPGATADSNTGSGRVSGSFPDPSAGTGRSSGMPFDPIGTGQNPQVRIDPIATGQHPQVRIDPIGTGQHPLVRIDPVGTGQHPLVRIDPSQRSPTPQFASGGFSTGMGAPALQSMSTGQPVMLGDPTAPKPAKRNAALVIAVLGLLAIVIGVGVVVMRSRSLASSPTTPEPSASEAPSASAAPPVSEAAPTASASASAPVPRASAAASATSATTVKPVLRAPTPPRKAPVVRKR